MARWVHGPARWLLAVVFVMAGVTKVTDLHGFADDLILRSPLPYAVAVVAAAFVPWLELTCGLCLALGQATREAAALLGVLLISLLGYTLLTPSAHDCGCFLFPKVAELPVWWSLARDLLLLGCSVIVARQ